PNEDGAFLINPYGLHFSEITASSLVKIDIEGNKFDPDNPWPVNRAGFVQHSLFHTAKPFAHAIIHTHATPIVAVCSVEGGLKPSNFYACNFVNQIGYHDFEGVTVREEEGERLLANLGDKRILMLRNHGPVVLGTSLPEAFLTYWVLQRACEIQLATAAMGPPLLVSDDVVSVHQRDTFMALIEQGQNFGVHEFNAMVRRVNKIYPGWYD
ncbi:MAG: class II aldolase/adducin family protein, partial [Alphaproteobacteria bacterium]|nr:class II aldolase/adducin family protein [Alphaproteobacteria bacterium]